MTFVGAATRKQNNWGDRKSFKVAGTMDEFSHTMNLHLIFSMQSRIPGNSRLGF